VEIKTFVCPPDVNHTCLEQYSRLLHLDTYTLLSFRHTLDEATAMLQSVETNVNIDSGPKAWT
jgi:hypothetical protein